ncbi:uncharacterized protein LOC132611026 [Lycium barbarum]|uniref:uncharacterized protein LOC132611026 n=1 Tax=Lycium barbarum TaxID=112863 RepID=UPI00293F20FE|nr:uncharacterized protein LOC132611026 [Lycium barbarum]
MVNDCEERWMLSLDQNDRMALNNTKAEVITHHKVVDKYWRQKANLDWYLEGDENTKYFHSIVKGRRKRLNILRAQVKDQSVEGDKEVDMEMINLVPTMITEDDNSMLTDEPSQEEIKSAVFDIDPNSSAGPDRFKTDFELEPISLSNVTQKIVSKVLNERLSRVIPRIISQNQSGFVKDRSIGENVCLPKKLFTILKSLPRVGM